VAEEQMRQEIDAVIEAGDTIGGSFVVVAEGMPIGVGSFSEWDTRLDAALPGVMGIQAVKGVASAWASVSWSGAVRRARGYPECRSGRRTNRAGGVEGGMSNGAIDRGACRGEAAGGRAAPPVDKVSPRAAPISAQRRGVLPRAAVGRRVALALADQLLTRSGGDTIGDLGSRGGAGRSQWPRVGGGRRPLRIAAEARAAGDPRRLGALPP
jgi:chorismate synthase